MAYDTSHDQPADTHSGPTVEIKSVGLRWFHPVGFQIIRPNGIQDYTFVQWLTPTMITIDGTTTTQKPGGCILYRPGDPHFYGGDAFTPFGNNWFHFNGAGVQGLLSGCRLPMNRPFYLRGDAFIESTLQLILWESMAERLEWGRALSAHAELFFVEMARALVDAGNRSCSARNMELRENFEAFREKLKARCAEAWTLPRMAQELHLSVSQFSKLYREFFNAKPVDDLIGMRINMAEYYLRTTAMPVSYIADMTGFSDTYYFSRVFKAKTGQTATAFRNRYHAQ